MLSLLAALLAAQVAPPQPEPPMDPARTAPVKPQDPPKPVEAKPPQEVRDRGIDLAALTDLVQKATKKELLANQFLMGRITMTPSSSLSADELFSFYASALATCGYALVKDLSVENRYRVVMLGQPLATPVPSYADPAKLPATEELCSLTIALASLTPLAAERIVINRMHPRLAALCVRTADTISIVDFAPTLKQLAVILARAEEEAARALQPVSVSWWLIDIKQGDKPHFPDSIKDLKDLLTKQGSVNATSTVTLENSGSFRSTPSEPGKGSKTTFSMRAFFPELSADLSPRVDRAQIRFDDVRLWKPEKVRNANNPTIEDTIEKTLFQVKGLALAPGEATVIWSDAGRVVVLKASTAK